MADLTDEQFRQKVLKVLNEKGADVTNEEDVEHITSVDRFGIDGGNIFLPGYQVGSEGQIIGYFSASLRIFCKFVKDKADEIYNAWSAWFGTAPGDGEEGSGVLKEWSELKTGATAAVNAAKEWYDPDHPDDGYKAQVTEAIGQASSDHNRAESDHGIAFNDHQTAEGDRSAIQSDRQYARQQGDYAKTQGDYAKQQADRLAALLAQMQN